MMNHIRDAVMAVEEFRGPQEGDVLVMLSWAPHECLILKKREAIQHIRENPRIEFKPIEKWALWCDEA